MEKKITQEELEVFLRKHKLWLEDKSEGCRANLRGANLYEADLCGANLCEADLYGANLYGADLCGAKYNKTPVPLVCPEEGAFIGFKKAKYRENNTTKPCIVKLEICKDAKRSSATTRKCRCSKAEVLSIETMDGAPLKEAFSDYDYEFTYTVGKTVSVKNFEEDRWAECTPGIHFFITREEAENY